MKLGDAITEDRALRFLESDVIKAYQALFRLVSIPLTDSQQTALVSFIFNLGAGRFQASTLRQKLNRRELDAAAQEFERWVYARHPIKGMMKMRGLALRKHQEKMLFLGEIISMSLKARSVPKHQRTKTSRSMGYAKPSLWQKAAAAYAELFKVC